jgi:AMP-polyphosphate phosphotransferase
MFESAELGHRVDDRTYKKEVDKLRGDLLEAQYELLRDGSFPVIVLVNGVDGAGKGETVNLLNEWLDPRHVKSRAFGDPTADEAARPAMWRFWRALPPNGKIGVLFGNWYTRPIVRRVVDSCSDAELLVSLERVKQFEKLLTDDGAVLVKLWFHLSKKAQKKRLAALEKDKLTRWRVTKQDWANFKRYDGFAEASERALRETSTGEAPWIVIEGTDPNFRSLTAGRILLSAIRGRLQTDRANKKRGGATGNGAAHATARLVESVDNAGILKDLPFEERLSKSKYETRIHEVQGTLNKLSRSPKMKAHSVVVVFEGMDAAGKGGAIRRVTQALDARFYDVIPIAAPTDEERAHPYLWRFWRHVPPRGRFVLYDRSWYGRVLVERVEKLCSGEAWTRAYAEINEFEEELTEHGIVVVKLWLAITKDEQLRRFKEREKTRFKQYKITADDWRNRKRWDDYIAAASDMIDRTSTALAPWTVIEANDKHLARVRVIETIAKRMRAAF